MYDFVRQIAFGEELTSIAFGLEPLNPTVLVHYLLVPECVKLAVVGRVHSVFIRFDFGHGDVTFRPKEFAFNKSLRADLSEAAAKEMTPEGGRRWGQS